MDKKQIKETVHGVAEKAAATANEKAKAASGWQKWLWAIGAVIAGAVAWFTQGCESVTPQQVAAAHEFFHAVTGEPCVLAQPECEVTPCKK